MTRKKSVLLVLILSIIPGLPQLYLGKFRKAVTLLIISVGVTVTFIFSGYYTVRTLMILVYSVTVIPACLESYQLAKYGKNTIDTGARWYVILLLFTTGFTAVPLLWRSDRFSRKGKIFWTGFVTLGAILFFTVLGVYWDILENFLRGLISR